MPKLTPDTPISEKAAKLSAEIAELRQQMVAELKATALGEISDYVLKRTTGEEVLLSTLFGDKKDLIVVHNMGHSCAYCTLWADGFNGVHAYLADRTGFVLVSPDSPAIALEFAKSRGWNFPVVSCEGTGFSQDLGVAAHWGNWPAVSTFTNEGGQIVHVATDVFGPGDMYCSAWSVFDLLKDGAGEWEPRYNK